jgi:DNA-binding CsgD family transcriptional regulator
LLAKIEKKEKHYEKALEDFETHNEYVVKVVGDNKNKALLELQEKYNFEKLKNENSKLTIKQQKILIASFAFLLCFSFITFFFYRKSIRNEKLILEAEQKIESLKNLVQNSLKKDNSVHKILVHHFNILKKVALINKNISDDDQKNGDRLIRQFNRIVYEQDALDWDKLYQTINKIQDNLYDRVREKYPTLEEMEFRLCYLSGEDFDDNEIAVIMKIAPHKIRKIRSNIRKKIGIPPYQNIYTFFHENLTVKE